MRGYVNIPVSISCKLCRECGSVPVIALLDDIGYIVKCSKDNGHYKTMPGLIDIDDWNLHNTILAATIDFNLNPVTAW